MIGLKETDRTNNLLQLDTSVNSKYTSHNALFTCS